MPCTNGLQKHLKLKELNKLNPDVIITNIHKIIDSDTLNMFPSKFINLHYSLLPSFAGYIGMETVEKAKEQKWKNWYDFLQIIERFND